jgi:choline dehydrogenase-like flavoprotein
MDQRRNLTVLTNTQATRVLFDGRRATGVEIRRDGALTLCARREVVLCGGAFNTPQLLMLSGVGDPQELDGTAFRCITPCPASARICRTTSTTCWSTAAMKRICSVFR